MTKPINNTGDRDMALILHPKHSPALGEHFEVAHLAEMVKGNTVGHLCRGQ